ncbi:hypothetical protein PVK06_008115 [Gossypium arboreum]|uniref:DUF4283 domain-containing protein n=1 Tax=Gossypium arboreum TaxID=29729 RepID=A0ABR0QJ50_GOSAR|nr:hypothetical protein PVK06_008115 [Gossypium arboreum]
MVKDMEITVVVKLLGRNIGYGVLHNQIYNLLRPSQPFRLMDVENGYYLVQFQNRDDYDMALTQGFWIVLGIISWPAGISVQKKKVFEDIRSLVGIVAKLDKKTGSGARGQFVRMEVFVDMEKQLTSQVLINGRVQHQRTHSGKDDSTNVINNELMSVVKGDAFWPWMYRHVHDLCPSKGSKKCRDEDKEGVKVVVPEKEKSVAAPDPFEP